MQGHDKETRERLLSTAERLFAERGFSKVTIREICKSARANVAAVNYHFNGKKGLYDEVVRTANPLLAHAVRFIGHSAIRNRGTVGGSIAHADPAAELPAVLLALDGEVDARSARGTRTVPASAFFEGFLTTSLEPDELLTAVRVPALPGGTGWSFQEFSRRSGDFAIVGVAATVQLDGNGKVGEARLAFSGADQVPVRAIAAESQLAGATPSDELWKSAAHAAAAPLEPASDIHGSAAYRTASSNSSSASGPSRRTTIGSFGSIIAATTSGRICRVCARRNCGSSGR